MAGEFEAAISVLHRSVRALEPDCLDGRDAAVLLERVIEGEKLLGAAKTLLTKRVDECRIWATEGHRGMADWLAARDGTSIGQANAVVETSAVSWVSGNGGRVAVTALLRVDAAAIRRLATQPGETCEIAGIGPIPVAAARELLGDALLKVLVTDGVDVRTVVHPNRTIASTIRTALLWQHPECSVTGCHETHGLEHHHTIDYVDTKHTKLDELTLICARHHDLVTHRGFRLQPRPDGNHNLIAPSSGTGDDTGPVTSDERGPPIAA